MSKRDEAKAARAAADEAYAEWAAEDKASVQANKLRYAAKELVAAMENAPDELRWANLDSAKEHWLSAAEKAWFLAQGADEAWWAWLKLEGRAREMERAKTAPKTTAPPPPDEI